MDDAAAGVEGVHEVITSEAGEFLAAGGFLLGALVAAVLLQESLVRTDEVSQME